MPVRKSKPPHNRRFKAYITSAALGWLASGAALLLFSLLVFLLKLPVAQSGFFSFLAFAIGCLVSGFFAGAIKRQGGLAAGIKAAVIFTLPVLALGFILGSFAVNPEIPPSAGESAETAANSAVQAAAAGAPSLNRIIIAILCGAIGGVLGVNRNGGF
jgi:putative membrane protein (TIGR04086 family)